MKNKDEFKTCHYVGEDYTIKTYQREDCRYYAIVLYETNDDSKVIYTSKSQPTLVRATNNAVDHIRKHRNSKLGEK